MAPRRASPIAGLMLKVKGTRRATPIVLVSPGREPTTMPRIVPRRTIPSIPGSNAWKKAGKSAERSIAALLKSPYLADRQSCAKKQRKEEINAGKE